MEFCKIIPFEAIEKIACVAAEGKGEFAGAVRQRTGADIVMNGPIFDMDSYRILQSFVCDGVQRGCADGLRGFRFDGNRASLAWSSAGAQSFISEFGLLVVDGAERCSVSASPNSRRGRTAIGITADEALAIYVVTDGESYTKRKTGKELAAKLAAMGCVQAINLDGGGSSQIADSSGAYASGRAVPGFLAVWLKKNRQEDDGMTVKATKKQNTYDATGKQEAGRYIAKGDVCTITKTITGNLLIEVAYPTAKGMRTAYVKALDGFTTA